MDHNVAGISPSLTACGTTYIGMETAETTKIVYEIESEDVEDPNVSIGLAAFQSALLQALTVYDATKSQTWMTDPSLSGTGCADLSDSSSADAVKMLFSDLLGVENYLILIDIYRTALWIEDTRATGVTGLPGQDSNRRILMVRYDLLLFLTFTLDEPLASDAYQHMQDLYARIVNTNSPLTCDLLLQFGNSRSQD